MNTTLSDLLPLLRKATRAEDVFGDLESLAALKQSYRRLAAVAHPDRNPSQPYESGEAFRMLGQWYAAGQSLIVQGAYGRPRIIDIVSPRNHYTGSQPPLSGDLCDLYPAAVGDEPVLLKAARAPRNNDLLQAEVKALQQFDRALARQPVRAHYPALIECFRVEDEDGAEHQTNVLRQELNFVSLAQIHRAFPQGIDAADAAWMFNRVLAALGLSHDLGLVHGCVTLDHILVRLSDHGGMLIDWCYSVETGAAVLAISPPYAANVAPEIHARRPVSPATDLYMAARCMVHLLGGQGPAESLPARVPRPIRDLLRACLLLSPHRRSNDAWQVMEDFGAILRHLYGPPNFRLFTLPPSSPS